MFFLVEAGASLDIVEQFNGDDNAPYFTNHMTQIIVKENATVNHIKLIEEGDASHHIAKIKGYLDRDSQLACHSFALKGNVVRSDLQVDLRESGAYAALNGLYLTSGKQDVAHYTQANHLSPHTSSDECYKGVLSGQSKGTFNGSIFVEKDAQKTDASQQNKNLLLSEKAAINTKTTIRNLC